MGVCAFGMGLVALILFIVKMQQQCYAPSPCCCDGSGGSGGGGSGGDGGGGGGGLGTAMRRPVTSTGAGNVSGSSPTGSSKVLTWDPVVAVKDFQSETAPSVVSDTPAHTEPTKPPADDSPPPAGPGGLASASDPLGLHVARDGQTVVAPIKLPFWAGLPNPVAMVDERQRYWARPETPEVATRRRQTLLREAAAELRLPRDGSMIPIGPPTVITADPATAAAVTSSLAEAQAQAQAQAQAPQAQAPQAQGK
jgi:hypothetical protein